MCKLHTYYITNAKKELPYYAINISENSLRNQMINTIMEISNELLEEDFDFSYKENVIDMIIDMFKTYHLNVISDVEIEFQIFNIEQKKNMVMMIKLLAKNTSMIILILLHIINQQCNKI